jgi:nucleoside-diphosphate-sugar epimerase
MNIVITGSTGFVGQHLVPKLINKRYQTLEITIEPEISEKLYGNKTQKYLITDDQESFMSILEAFKPDVVIHLASSLTSADDYNTLRKLLNTNIVFYCRILDALKNTNLKLFINTGTFAEYFSGDGVFDPAYLYSATKIASRAFLDYYSKVYSFKQATVVPYTIYGGKDTQKKIMDLIYDSIGSATPLDLSPGEQVLDFIHVDDVTDFYVKIIENIELLPQKFNFQLGTGVGHTLKQVAAIIEEITQQKTNINWGGKSYRPSDVMYAVANNDEQLKQIKWEASLSLKEGIENFIKIKTNT